MMEILAILSALLECTALAYCVRLDRRVKRIARRLNVVEGRTPPIGVPEVRIKRAATSPEVR